MKTFVNRAIDAADRLNRASVDRGRGDPLWSEHLYLKDLLQQVDRCQPDRRGELLVEVANGVEAAAEHHPEQEFLTALARAIRSKT